MLKKMKEMMLKKKKKKHPQYLSHEVERSSFKAGWHRKGCRKVLGEVEEEKNVTKNW